MNNIFPSEIVLKRGSHELPSDGSCAMEVAVLAAGFGWHQIVGPFGLPLCFSRVLGSYVIRLNDTMPDYPRQKLMKYVERLGSTADTPEIELERTEYLAMNAAKPAAVCALMASEFFEHAEKIGAANTFTEFRDVMLGSYDRCSTYFSDSDVYNVIRYTRSVSYTHLTLPTNREV